MKQLAKSGAWGMLLGVLLLGQAACTYKKVKEDPTPTLVACTLPTTISYQTNVWPILKQNCRDACHNPQMASQYANFNMDSFSQVQYYATTKPRNLSYSYLAGNIRHESGYVWMPVGAAKLDDCQIALIEAWIAAGALNN